MSFTRRQLMITLSVTVLANVAGAVTVCARSIRPYAEAASFWHDICGITVSDPNTVLMATNLEFFDPSFECDTNAGFVQAQCVSFNSCGGATDCDHETPT
ncbi:hypothetical protein PC9H_000385 [Pleurotus ostreatus]|uniref:Uncharacterized protein n=1 Tax=Pleurotus ostreatus TaxID=5322 RepID=A0A8H7DV82_PLEOS|nr:uncharacterized protein PC9H_000385 [Pleurotus ostreatus]KAF7440044.1 hypothetical protein PC9H_000385 [Pleurotus ostreatus]KAJ8700720.1 hypothetical protein PTI98_003719 [Pleurotus ostreatus]